MNYDTSGPHRKPHTKAKKKSKSNNFGIVGEKFQKNGIIIFPKENWGRKRICRIRDNHGVHLIVIRRSKGVIKNGVHYSKIMKIYWKN